ncbi:DUF3156 family protein [Pseudomonas chlororaphis]|uniref:DUF3156 family protein n=1 Tax=Pseudomonas chlororaphis TaxID=587753 RepID=A0A1Q8EPL2_9PSED|nr:DUF3156 family protein [Pseudomonas chlororaphis]OLF53721.1 hypothetical protein BTN82_15760 [Pseudomonas chlororaphis]
MSSTSWRQNLSDFWRRPPSGYRPGATLNQLCRDLPGLDWVPLAPGAARFAWAEGGLVFEVQELPQAQFLMHLVVCEFRLQIPARPGPAARIDLRHTGAIRRQGFTACLKQGTPEEWAELLQRLGSDPQLLEALLPLDFKRLQLRRGEQGWTVCLEHFGASEVVNRLPGFRRYIRLSAEQRGALLATFKRLRQLLDDH